MNETAANEVQAGSEPARIQRTLNGRVIANAMDKTVTVLIQRLEPHPLYQKYVRRSTKLHVHDEQNVCQVGDTVSIRQCRPLSKTKSWTLVEVLKSGTE